MRLQHESHPLASGVHVSLRDFAELPAPKGDRRLLVLNACDSATAASLGGPSRVGLAGIGAGTTQAVIAHLWPVRWIPAACFGVLLATGLVRNKSFLSAFRYAVKMLQSGLSETDPALSAEIRSLLKRLQDLKPSPLDLSSTCFVQ